MNFGSGCGYLGGASQRCWLSWARRGRFPGDYFSSSKVGVPVGLPRPTTAVSGKTRVARPRWVGGSYKDGPK